MEMFELPPTNERERIQSIVGIGITAAHCEQILGDGINGDVNGKLSRRLSAIIKFDQDWRRPISRPYESGWN